MDHARQSAAQAASIDEARRGKRREDRRRATEKSLAFKDADLFLHCCVSCVALRRDRRLVLALESTVDA